MHPDATYADLDEPRALATADRIGFAQIITVVNGSPALAYAPAVRTDARTFCFHLARANRVAPHLAGTRAVLSFLGPHGYITPAWYHDRGGSVPTWNYIAVELEGTVRLVPEPDLLQHIDALAQRHEPQMSGTPWVRSRVDPDRIARMVRGIAGFALAVDQVRATRKLGQDRSARDRAGVVLGLEAAGNPGLAAEMRHP
ncbi:FMN-binding negative transcriptional regulator [Erythrobacteraceae bacterium CFH 75059]|uniref:FMN-binding negative transcriptional regulator n=1 Tax=Qipengyuania thermophila TaxID=2509361 RepID=UPI00101E9D4F|nr:FMN-binding negative transcriptional regulator [Qipengyuania thermophila]TCD06240.1 FMN-binding negative transcriptional regulator [Erythrobacteraceae bacterium CFH 75059]